MANEVKLINDGGPAFPVQESMISGSTGEVPASSGMSLRDWFAGQAIVGLIHIGASPIREVKNSSGGGFDFPDSPYYFGGNGGCFGEENMAIDAYTIADAMLAARKK